MLKTLILLIGFVCLSASGAQTNRPAASQPTQPKAQSTQKSPVGTNKVTSAVKATAPATASTSTAGDDKAIDAVMDKFEAAVRSGNLTYPIEVMYTPVMNQMGGRAQLLATAQAVQAQMKAQNVSYISWKAQKPYSYVNGTERRYAVIKYEAVFNAAGKKLKVKNCLLGIKVSPTTWQFIMGDELTPAFNHQFIPDFPTNIQMPKAQSTEL